MAGSFTPYKYRRRLIACFFVGAVPPLIAVLTVPASSALGIFLSGLLVALGATGYGFVLFACILAAGLLGVALGLLISYIIKNFKNSPKSLTQNNKLLKETRMDEKSQFNQLTEENSIELVSQQEFGADKSNVDAIDNLLRWGEEIRKALYKQVANQADKEVVKNNLSENLQKLSRNFRRLAPDYHPDMDPNSPQKAWKEEMFKKLVNAYDTIKEYWGSALEGINKPIISVDNPANKANQTKDMANEIEIDTLLAEQNELLREQIQLRKEYLEELKKVYKEITEEADEIIKNFFTKERREQTKNELRNDLKKEFPHLWPNNGNNEEPQRDSPGFSSYVSALGTYTGTFFSNISSSLSQIWNQTCNGNKEAQAEEKEQLSPPPGQTSFSCTPFKRCNEDKN